MNSIHTNLQGKRRSEESAATRVVITGIGLITPLGNTVEENWESLMEGRPGIDRVKRFDPGDVCCRIAGEVKNFKPETYFDRKDLRWMDRFTLFAIVATSEALQQAGMIEGTASQQVRGVDPERIGVVLGSGQGGLETFQDQVHILYSRGHQRVSPFFIPGSIINMAGGAISQRFNLQGPNYGMVSACATGANAIGEGYHILRRGEADVMVVGGSEAPVTPTGLAGFCAARALSTRNDEPARACRPFDAKRDGFVMGEGAGVFVLESLERAQARGAHIWAELLGQGVAADAYHITAPHPEGRGAIAAMRAALRAAGLAPHEIGYINAHATSTPLGDAIEARAIRTIFAGDASPDDPSASIPPVSSTKSMTGHLLGGAGAVEGAYTALALYHQVLPPTINQEEPDPEIKLDTVPNKARPASFDFAISNAFGFGGTNATLVLGRLG